MTGERTIRPRPDKTRLETWKEVAAFFGKTERTVKRWEKDRGLPIHRLPGASRSRIYADVAELEAWLKSADPEEVVDVPDPEPETVPEVLTPPPAPEPRKPNVFMRLLVGCGALFALLAMASLLSAHFHAPRQPPPADAQAAYLKGLDALDDQRPESLAQAVEAYQQAVDLSPDYAEAYVGLAHSLMKLPDYGEAATRLTPAQAFREAEVAAHKAVAIDRKLGTAQAALGLSRYYGEWDTDGARRAFKKALQLSPDNGLTRFPYARFLMLRGAFGDALSEINRAVELNPSSPAIKADRALLLSLTGRRAEALEMLSTLINEDPRFATAYLYLAEVNYADGRDEAACTAWSKLAELRAEPQEQAAADAGCAALKDGGRKAMWQAMLDQQLKAPTHQAVSAYETAAFYAALGDQKQALTYLHEAARLHEPGLVRLGLDPRLAGLKSDAEFTRFAARFVDVGGI